MVYTKTIHYYTIILFLLYYMYILCCASIRVVGHNDYCIAIIELYWFEHDYQRL